MPCQLPTRSTADEWLEGLADTGLETDSQSVAATATRASLFGRARTAIRSCTDTVKPSMPASTRGPPEMPAGRSAGRTRLRGGRKQIIARRARFENLGIFRAIAVRRGGLTTAVATVMLAGPLLPSAGTGPERRGRRAVQRLPRQRLRRWPGDEAAPREQRRPAAEVRRPALRVEHRHDSTLGKYYYDESFGIRPADVPKTEKPTLGLTIPRDRAGVPHVFSQ